MVSQWTKVNPENQRILIAVGAGAGLAAAFNAPLAGLVLIGKEMRPLSATNPGLPCPVMWLCDGNFGVKDHPWPGFGDQFDPI